MDLTVAELEERLARLELEVRRPCSGCADLEKRVTSLELQLAGAATDTLAESPVDELLRQVQEQSAEAGAGAEAEDEDDISRLLREARQVDFSVMLEEEGDDGGALGAVGLPISVADTLETIEVCDLLLPEPGASLDGAEAYPTPAAPAPAPPNRQVCHLILGDSIARGLALPCGPKDTVLNLAEGGNTWHREAGIIRDHLSEWAEETRRRGAERGDVFIWMGGNDIYGRPGGRAGGLQPHAVAEVLEILREWGRVVAAGPTIRLFNDKHKQWEDTPAFVADKQMRVLATEAGVEFLPYIGRALTVTKRINGTKKHFAVPDKVGKFFRDSLGIHLSEEGYRKVLQHLDHVFVQ